MTQTLRRDRDVSLARLKYEVAAFRFRLAMLDLDAVLAAEEVKYNPNHDPTTGRFTSGGGSFGGAGSSGGWSGRDPSRSNPDPGGVGVVPPGGGAPLPMRPSRSEPTTGGQTTTSSPSVSTPGENARISSTIKAQVDAIRAEFERQTGLKLRVTSGERTPEEQAQAMYDKLQKGGSLSIYSNKTAAAEVQAAYDAAIKAGAGKAADVTDMASVLRAQVGRGIYISKHLTKSAIDISMLSADKKYLKRDDLGTLFSIIEKHGGKILQESRPPHIHVQF